LPRLIPLAYSALGEFVLEPLGFRPDVAFESVRMAKQRMYYDISKARLFLRYAPSPVTRALADAVTWFADHGYLSARSGRDNGNRT
jgi:dihydroflavonol-4-reductase